VEIIVLNIHSESATRNKINRHLNRLLSDNQLKPNMVDQMRKLSRQSRFTYYRDGPMRVVDLRDKDTGELLGSTGSPISYQEASVQVLFDVARDRGNGKSAVSNVTPYALCKHPGSLPNPNFNFTVPKNPILTSVCNMILNEEEKKKAASHGYSLESGNYYGARDLLQKGPSMPNYLLDTPLIDVSDVNDDDDLASLFEDEGEENSYAYGYLASNFKNAIDDTLHVKLFPVPLTVSDPGFLQNLDTIDPPDGSTHDLNMDPEYGENKAKDRKQTTRITADYICSKCKCMERHYIKWVSVNGVPSFWKAIELITEAMKSHSDPVCMFTTFKAFPKIEAMTSEKIILAVALRMIWGPGGVEAILGKLLLKNVTLCSFKRYKRGNAHGVDAKDGGFNRMFHGMMDGAVHREKYLQIAEELGMDPDDFEDMLEHFGWRDDDIQKWDTMQFQVYMHQNFAYYIMQYDWSEKITVDQCVWLYMLISLAIIDTTVVSDMGHGLEIYKRILASGLFLTASGGSKTHDTLSHAYAYRQTMTAITVKRRIDQDATIDPKLRHILQNSYDAFSIGTSFVHFSDDFLQCALRQGLPFGQLVNRNAFFARNCNLSFKVNKRNWRSDIGKVHKTGMVLLMKTHPHIFEGVRDILETEEIKEEMNGVVTEFELIPYERRVEQWYPLISEINSDDGTDDGTLKYKDRPEGIVVKGISFLRFHFIREVYGDMQYIMPIRDEDELWHKLYVSSVEYRNPAQIALKLRMYQFYIYKWPKARATFKRIHDYIMEKFLPDMEGFKDDDILKRELPRKLGINFEELVATYPTVFDVENFLDLRKVLLHCRNKQIRETLSWVQIIGSTLTSFAGI